MNPGWRPGVLLVAALLAMAPLAGALNVATKSIKARPSGLYSPDTAWEEGYYGCNTTIAVFDNGVDDEHPYFDSKVAAGQDTTATGPVWEEANDGNPQPILGDHGTPVAGIVHSNAGQSFTQPSEQPNYEDDALVGVAPCAHMVDVMFNDVAGDDGSIEQEMVQAFSWAIEHRNASWGDDETTNDGIDAITMSWSPDDKTDGSDPVCKAATEAVEAGIVVLGSAGNSGRQEEPDLGCPTGADGAISVANLYNQRTVDRSDDELRETSTWGPREGDGDATPYDELRPTVAAPGHEVVSTGASVADGREYGLACFGTRDVPEPIPDLATFIVPKCEESFGGTSAATPMTAGVVALMLDANPDLSPAGVKAILQQTADPHEEMDQAAEEHSAVWDHRYGYGMIDAHEAVTMAERWPGLEAGKDTDADGLRDPFDAGPFAPNVTETVQPENLTAAGEGADTDGDGVLDREDTQPLNPNASDEPLDQASADTDEEGPVPVPAPGLGVALALLGAGLVHRGRSPRT